MSDPSLITPYNWHGQLYMVKVNVLNNTLEISVVDKKTGEEWQCNYDHLYVENLTHKTGNYKQFDTFVTMLKSGLLKTSDCISLDLLTYDDLESLRIRKFKSKYTLNGGKHINANRRYLIVKYIVEFDRIHYPLPLEYCGPPDPSFLQSTIKHLESELVKVKDELNLKNNHRGNSNSFKQRIEELEVENQRLREHLHQQMISGNNNNNSSSKVEMLQNAISQLERSVQMERKSHHKLVEKMRIEKVHLVKEVEKLKYSEMSLRSRLNQADSKKRFEFDNNQTASTKTLFRRSRSSSLENRKTIPSISNQKLLSPSPVRSLPITQWTKSNSRHNNSKNTLRKSTTSLLASSTTSSSKSLEKFLSKSRSRSNSVSSKGSSTSSGQRVEKIKSKPNSLNAKVNRHKLDFCSLEKKVSDLQKMLNVNLR